MEKEKQLNIDISPEEASGHYSNLALITHSSSEFVIDFASMLPGLPKPKVQSRIIMTPEHAKRLLAALSDNMSRYEAMFGPIEIQRMQEQRNTMNIVDINPNGTKS